MGIIKKYQLLFYIVFVVGIFGVVVFSGIKYTNHEIIPVVETVANAENTTSKKNHPSVLTCANIKENISEFISNHYSIKKFDEEISKRTFNKFFQMLDPGKLYFLQEDIDKFKAMETALPQSINKVDCRFISDVYELYIKRSDEIEKMVNRILETPFDFKVDESIDTDRKSQTWTKNAIELTERWRKQLKFMAITLKDTETNDQVIKQRLLKRFQLIKRSIADKSVDEINNLFMNAFANALDPHSDYMLPSDQDEFQLNFSLHFVGIGASLTSQDGYTTIDGIIPGGAAAKDGRLKKGDKIIAVDSGDGAGFVDVVDMELNKVVQLIRGKKSTVVKLKVLRKAENSQEMQNLIIDLLRDDVNLADGMAKSDILQINGKKIGIVNLPSFYIDYKAASENKGGDFRSSARDVAREVIKLKEKNVDGILIDLRRNGGGDLGECIRLTSLFIESGSVVQVENRDAEVSSYDDKDKSILYSGPLGVLISRQSASASEIFANAIKDYGRGVILGNSRTYGKATVQNIIELPGTDGRKSNGALKVTVSKFFSPSGRSNQERGVPSDITIPDLMDISEISEAENDYVLPYSTVAPNKKFKPLQDLSGIIEKLKSESMARINKSKEFTELKEKIQKNEKEREKKMFSLKIDDTNKKKTPTPLPKTELNNLDANDNPQNKVILPSDIQLKEAANILLDSIELLGGKKDWTK